jgi:hypothetical protein
MSEFEDLEGPRRNKQEVHLVFNENRGLSAILTSRVEARNMKTGNSKYQKHLSVKTKNAEAHIGDKLWFVCDADSGGWPTTAYHDEQKAKEQANKHNILKKHLYSGTIKHWDVTSEKLFDITELRERRENGRNP